MNSFRKNSLKRDSISHCYSVKTLLSDISALSFFDRSEDVRDVYASLSKLSADPSPEDRVAVFMKSFKDGVANAIKNRLPDNTLEEDGSIFNIQNFETDLNNSLNRGVAFKVNENSMGKMGQYSAVLYFLGKSQEMGRGLESAEYERLLKICLNLRRNPGEASFVRDIIDDAIRAHFGKAVDQLLKELGAGKKQEDMTAFLRILLPRLEAELKSLSRFDIYHKFIDKYKTVWGKAYPPFIELYNYVLKNHTDNRPLSQSGDPEQSINDEETELKVMIQDDLQDDVKEVDAENVVTAMASMPSGNTGLVRLGLNEGLYENEEHVWNPSYGTEDREEMVPHGDIERLQEMSEFLETFKGGDNVNLEMNNIIAKRTLDLAMNAVLPTDPAKIDDPNIRDEAAFVEVIISSLNSSAHSPVDEINMSVWIVYHMVNNSWY